MIRSRTPLFRPTLIVGLLLGTLLGGPVVTRAAVVSYVATLNGANESPPVATAGAGIAQVDIDAVAHTMRVYVTFSGLTGNTTASHIHAATATALTGTAGVATTTPTFTAFPLGVTSGTYDRTYDMTLTTSYNPSYITAHGGTTTQAEADLFQAITDGKAYLNVHSSFAAGGEIRGFLVPGTTATAGTTWGRLKSLYR